MASCVSLSFTAIYDAGFYKVSFNQDSLGASSTTDLTTEDDFSVLPLVRISQIDTGVWSNTFTGSNAIAASNITPASRGF